MNLFARSFCRSQPRESQQRGRFHVEPSRKIVFETGPLVKATSKLLAGPAIGLNLDGGSFYATTCELKKK